MQLAILILVFVILLGALAWHGGRELWTQRDSPRSKLYYGMAGTLGMVMLATIKMTTSSEIPTGLWFMVVVFITIAISRHYQIDRQQYSV